MARQVFTLLLKSYGILGFLFCVMLALSDQLRSHPSADKKWDLAASWIISPGQAVALTQTGAFLLDARSLDDRLLKSIPTAKIVNWEDYSVPNSPLKGRLLPKDQLAKKLDELGIKHQDKIIVVGDPLDGWGEEGRIVWTLRSAGFHRSYLVDGGADKFLEKQRQGSSALLNEVSRIEPSQVAKESTYDITAENLLAQISRQQIESSVLDVREEREFLGSTPYGESRGGHIPRAKWIYYKDFIDSEGYVKSREKILEILVSKKIPLDKPIISYCTGGIRSAFTTSVFISYGIKAKNYSGSMWEWTSMDANSFPLKKGPE